MTLSLSKLESLAKEATPGPWSYDNEMFVFDSEMNMIAEMRGAGAELAQDANGRFVSYVNPATALTLIRIVKLAKNLVDNWNMNRDYWNSELAEALKEMEK